MCRTPSAAALAVLLVFGCFSANLAAQAANESLGPADSHGKVKGTPLLAEMKTLPSSVKPVLANVHPRVYFTGAEIDALRTKIHTHHAAEWKQELAHLRVFGGDPPPPPAEKRRAQNDVAFAIAEGAFAYAIERDPKILAATKKYMDAAVSYDIWGYAFSKPNTDLAAGHLLYGMGVAYDLLYNDLSSAERARYRATLARHGELLYQYFAPKPGRAYAYSQNHTFIPMSGLGVAAYAVYGEVPEAKQWAALSRAIFDRVLATYSRDGYYYEGYEYWIFATPWIIHYLDAQRHATGEDLFDQPGLRQTHLYAAHALLPGGEFMFDFGDVFEGPITRARQGEDYERSHPNGHLESNYNILYDLAARFHSSEIQGVADWMKSQGHTGQEPWWTLVWHDDALPAESITKLPPYHRFEDHDVAFWRSSWNADATAFAFKCGPPEGHHTEASALKYPDFHMEQGHVHPDVNSFILFAHGQYLTGDSGYAGVPRTVEHNTLLVDGHGQGKEGGHDAWAGMDYARLNSVRLTDVKLSREGFDLTGEGAGAYDPATGLTRFTRHIQMSKAGEIRVSDTIETSRPEHLTEVLHTDAAFKKVAKDTFTTDVHGIVLHASEASSSPAAAKAEANVVMGPGRPGSVDKGTPEPRGERVVVTTDQPVTHEDFHWTLTW
ncbi:MAG TPA: DUF4962 domain-containing protein [Acidobacteriaceae bacterium]